MTYGEYFDHHGPADFQHFNEEMDQADRESWQSDLRDVVHNDAVKVFGTLLSTPTAAYRDAVPLAGPFPLFLYSGGKGSRADANLELAEYLASHGYVVATVPQLGPSPNELELGSSPNEIGLHADDFDTALERLHELPEIDFQHVAVGGHSAGGEAAIELAFRHAEIQAIVGLDASYGMTGGSSIFRQIAGYQPGREMHASLLDLRRADGSQGAKLDLSAVDRLRWASVDRILFAGAYHGDFTEWGMIARVLSIPMPANMTDHTRELGYRVNRQAYQAVLYFLDETLGSQGKEFGSFVESIRNTPGLTYYHSAGVVERPAK